MTTTSPRSATLWLAGLGFAAFLLNFTYIRSVQGPDFTSTQAYQGAFVGSLIALAWAADRARQAWRLGGPSALRPTRSSVRVVAIQALWFLPLVLARTARQDVHLEDSVVIRITRGYGSDLSPVFFLTIVAGLFFQQVLARLQNSAATPAPAAV